MRAWDADVDWLLLHQANIRIMEHAADVLGIPMEKVFANIQEYGNTSAEYPSRSSRQGGQGKEGRHHCLCRLRRRSQLGQCHHQVGRHHRRVEIIRYRANSSNILLVVAYIR